jgi:hypothetical protein
MKEMSSSMEEIDRMKLISDNREEVYCKWWRNKFERDEKVINQFECDNVFFISRKIWSIVIKEKIPITINGVDIGQKKLKLVKSLLRKGIKVRYSVMLKLRKFISYSITDTIDQGRVDKLYFRMMKDMKMFNRLIDLEKLLLSRKWNNGIRKKVKHIHVLGSLVNLKMKRSDKLKSFAICISENVNFEVV